jgi:hypothetical protein
MIRKNAQLLGGRIAITVARPKKMIGQRDYLNLRMTQTWPAPVYLINRGEELDTVGKKRVVQNISNLLLKIFFSNT